MPGAFVQEPSNTPIAMTLVTVFSHLPMLRAAWKICKNGWVFECFVCAATFITSMLYHMTNSTDTHFPPLMHEYSKLVFTFSHNVYPPQNFTVSTQKTSSLSSTVAAFLQPFLYAASAFSLDELRWHRLDNVFSQAAIGMLGIYLAEVQNPFINETLKVVCLFVAMVTQEIDPWNELYTFIPLIAWFVFPVWHHVFVHNGHFWFGETSLLNVNVLRGKVMSSAACKWAASLLLSDETSSGSNSNSSPRGRTRSSSVGNGRRSRQNSGSAHGRVKGKKSPTNEGFRWPNFDWPIFARGVGIMAIAVCCFMRGLSDNTDPYGRLFHGGWHFFGGFAAAEMWQVVRKNHRTSDTWKKLYDEHATIQHKISTAA